MVSGFQLWLAAFRGKRGGIVSLKCVAKTKVSPLKGYNAAFNQNPASFVDVTGLSLSVNNNLFYAVRGTFSNDANGGAVTLQILEGATVKYTVTISSSPGQTATMVVDQVFKNTSGGTQTCKVQIKGGGGIIIAYITTMSIIAGTYMDGLSAWIDVTSIDMVTAAGTGTQFTLYEGLRVDDSSTSIVTYPGPEKFLTAISFQGHVAWDWAGNQMVSSCV
jgi:hypothetical protein